MGIKIKMRQNVCGMGCFHTKKVHVQQQYLQRVLQLCGMRALSVTAFTEKLCGVTQHCVEWGVNPRYDTICMGLLISNLHFRACYYAFLAETPPLCP